MIAFEELPSPLWILGTDTGVGKTHVAALLARAWARLGPVEYRKPFQTGVQHPRDLDADAPRVEGPGIHAEAFLNLREPLSPLAAARAEGRTLDLPAALDWTARPPAPGSRLILEAAGGVMVPLAPGICLADWAQPLGIPALVVARGGLGTLNHALLTCEALERRGWKLAALLLNAGVDASEDAAQGNAALLRSFLRFPVHVLGT